MVGENINQSSEYVVFTNQYTKNLVCGITALTMRNCRYLYIVDQIKNGDDILAKLKIGTRHQH